MNSIPLQSALFLAKRGLVVADEGPKVQPFLLLKVVYFLPVLSQLC